jgi:hypothetical protein
MSIIKTAPLVGHYLVFKGEDGTSGCHGSGIELQIGDIFELIEVQDLASYGTGDGCLRLRSLRVNETLDDWDGILHVGLDEGDQAYFTLDDFEVRAELYRPCPFCGGRDVMGRTGKTSEAFCASCGAVGPPVERGSTSDVIARAWNKRNIP